LRGELLMMLVVSVDVNRVELGAAAAVLLLGNRLGWRTMSATFDRERLITTPK
jgi:hypothetical protein